MKKLICILLALLLLSPACFASSHAPLELSPEEAAAANLFLSNFTEIGMQSITSYAEDADLVDFAHDHLWFNSSASFEYGDYFSDNNCRVSDDRIQEIVDKYFYFSREVDLSQTRFDYAGGYYYHCETGGWTPAGFAHVVSICPAEEDIYYASFLIFGGGYPWDNGVMDDSLEEIEAAYDGWCGYGCAQIYAEDLADRSTYRLISYAQLW